MELNPAVVPWGKATNTIFLNPQLPKSASEALLKMASLGLEQLNLKQHLVLASSGSTVSDFRFLKLVLISQEAFLASAGSVCYRLSLTNADTWLQWLPRFHVGGLSIEARQRISGGFIISETAWDIERFKTRCRENSFQLMSVVPAQLFDIVQAQVKAPNSCRGLILGGGAVGVSIIKQAQKLGWRIYFSYGMTETSSMISLSENDYLNPLPEVEIKLNEKSLVGIRAPGLATATIQFSENTEEMVVSKISKTDYFWTQDLAENKEGRIRIIGREGDFVKIGGEGTNLQSLREIWQSLILQTRLEMNSLALLAIPDERLGHKIILVAEHDLESQTKLIEDLINDFSKQVLPNQKIRQTYWIPKIPRSELGKILWKVLEEQILERKH